MSVNQKYKIIKDRVEIYKDFTINLLNYIVDYYLDNKTLGLDEDIRNHFNWCFNKVCDEFKLEGIDFSGNKKLREYFYDFYYHQFYKREFVNGELINIAQYDKFWRNVFDINRIKHKNIINTLIEIYTIFDVSINTEKNILEIV